MKVCTPTGKCAGRAVRSLFGFPYGMSAKNLLKRFTRFRSLIEMRAILKCTKHPNYRAVRRPTSKCMACIRIYMDTNKGEFERIHFADGSDIRVHILPNLPIQGE